MQDIYVIVDRHTYSLVDNLFTTDISAADATCYQLNNDAAEDFSDNYADMSVDEITQFKYKVVKLQDIDEE